MKSCPECQVVGELLEAEYIHVGGGAIQTLDTKLSCKEHGEYEGNWTPERAKELVPPPPEEHNSEEQIPTLEEYVAAGYLAENYAKAFGGRTPQNTPGSRVA
jgi:hypothetical protein